MSKFPSESRVQICGLNVHDCGYCKNEKNGKKNTSVSYGFLSEFMTVEDYQSIMLLGWRRSGKYFYKPIMNRTCCPQYPIRLHVNEHKLSKSQKKVLKNVEKYLSALTESVTTNSSEDGLRLSSEFTFSSLNPTMETPAVSPKSGGEKNPKITVELDAASFTEEKFALYRQYQIDVHKDKPEELTDKGFKRFLCESPLKDTKKSARPDTSYQYGTFHQLYRLNGKLIAVGVVDLLPLGLSSVYVFYDNSLKQLALGKYTALKEIEFCRTHHFAYYFMGFYIHKCEKMRYKGEYKPSDLLCPTTFQWFPLHPHCSDVLDKFNFSPLEPSLAARRALVLADVGGGDAGDTGSEAGAGAEGAEGRVEGAGDTGNTGAKLSAKDTAASSDAKEVSPDTSASASASPVTGEKGPSQSTGSRSGGSGGGVDSSASVAEKSAQSATENKGATEKSAQSAGDTKSHPQGDSKVDGPGSQERGESGEDEEEEEDPTSVMKDVNLKLLDEFAPQFPSRTGASTSSPASSSITAAAKTTATSASPDPSAMLNLFQAVKQIPLDVGVGMPISLTQLRPESINQLRPFLEEWISYVGPEMGATIAVSFV